MQYTALQHKTNPNLFGCIKTDGGAHIIPSTIPTLYPNNVLYEDFLRGYPNSDTLNIQLKNDYNIVTVDVNIK